MLEKSEMLESSVYKRYNAMKFFRCVPQYLPVVPIPPIILPFPGLNPPIPSLPEPPIKH